MTAFHLINRVGSLTTDDYKIAAYQRKALIRPMFLNPRRRLAVSIHRRLPILMSSYAGDLYITSGFLGTEGYLTVEQLLGLKNAGQQIGGSYRIPAHLPQLNDTDLHTELADSKRDLEAIVGSPVVDFASPYGNTTSTSSICSVSSVTVHNAQLRPVTSAATP